MNTLMYSVVGCSGPQRPGKLPAVCDKSLKGPEPLRDAILASQAGRLVTVILLADCKSSIEYLTQDLKIQSKSFSPGQGPNSICLLAQC